MLTLKMHDDSSTEHVDFEEIPTESEIEEAIEEWVQNGEWGEEGASITVYWTLEEDGQKINCGFHEVNIEPNHEYLIEQVKNENSCGNNPEDHDWMPEQTGCSQNPGVWNIGGTKLVFKSFCKTCGLKQTSIHMGSQKNPGEHDSVAYEMD